MATDTRIIDLFGIALPLLQAPMAGASGPAMAIAVSEAGGLGALPCALLTQQQARAQIDTVRKGSARPLHLNFFVHPLPAPDAAREAAWRARLAPYYAELGLPAQAVPEGPLRAPLDEAMCALIEDVRPAVVSFHFGLPTEDLLGRVRRAGCKVISSATTVAEARWLEGRGCDAIIAQGAEAGGHRGMFLTEDVTQQPGLFALLPQVVDAVRAPVIAAGAIADERGVRAAIALGAAAVQIGTAYLRTPESLISPPHRAALAEARDDGTQITNVLTGRPARGLVTRLMREVGPMSAEAPPFPRAALAGAPLRTAAEARGSGDFSPLWAGQAGALARDTTAAELTRRLGEAALAALAGRPG